MTRILLVGCVLLAAISVAVLIRPRSVLACQIAPLPLELRAQHAEMIVVGEVVSEEAERNQTYTSTVRVAATLKGEAQSELMLEGLGQRGSDCSGGPRLEQGERLLLFLTHRRSSSDSPTVEPGAPMIYGDYRIADGVARSPFDLPHELPAGLALGRVAAIAGAPVSELDAALAFAAGEDGLTPSLTENDQVVMEDDGGTNWRLIGGISGVALIAIAAVGLVIVHRFRRT